MTNNNTIFEENRIKMEFLNNLQKKAVEKIRCKDKHIIALPTGQGKTRIALALASGNTLIIVDRKAHITQWESEMKELGVSLGKFTKIVNKDSLNAEARQYYIDNKVPVYDTIIIDEAHALKNMKGLKYQYVRGMCSVAKKVYLLTATPVQNGSGRIELAGLAHLIGKCPHKNFFKKITPEVENWCRENMTSVLFYEKRNRIIFEIEAKESGMGLSAQMINSINKVPVIVEYVKKLEGQSIIFTKFKDTANKIGWILGCPVITGDTKKACLLYTSPSPRDS